MVVLTQNKVTPAEATIAWFYSGKQQPLIYVNYIIFYKIGCLKALSTALNIGGFAVLPHLKMRVTKGN